jgi:hypothetical protein
VRCFQAKVSQESNHIFDNKLTSLFQTSEGYEDHGEWREDAIWCWTYDTQPFTNWCNTRLWYRVREDTESISIQNPSLLPRKDTKSSPTPSIASCCCCCCCESNPTWHEPRAVASHATEFRGRVARCTLAQLAMVKLFYPIA